VTRTISAFANADGGELIIGIEDDTREWRGFSNAEAANQFVQTIEAFFPLGDVVNCQMMKKKSEVSLLLRVEVKKSKDIKKSSDGKIYLRRGAQNLPVIDPAHIVVLERNKGISSFETSTVPVEKETITNSECVIKFLIDVIPTAEPEPWLMKQQLIVDDKPTVAGVVLFSDEPQAALPKRCGVKIYRYKTIAAEGTREALDAMPLSIEGNMYDQIYETVEKTAEIIQTMHVHTGGQLVSLLYPRETLHEIITNAVLHRDYGVADDIHVRIFDNRIEVESPGLLPGHVTPINILKERFARNPAIVRLINKFPNAPNKDVGEGLNTAFDAMRKMKLKDPIIIQRDATVLVLIKHEQLASPEEMVLKFLGTAETITNRQAREICFIGSENQMKRILLRMVKSKMIEPIEVTSRAKSAYKRVAGR